tara:strand:+ start:344 stop:946 length:603 start_codon:yes stop_codon:yes gene_type:complete
MAIIAQSARYGSGLFGLSRYGQINLSVSLASVTATSAVNTVQLSASSKVIPTGVVGTGSVAPVAAGGFEIDITESISTGVSSTGSVNTVTVNIGETVVGVTATGAVNTVGLIANATFELTGVSSTISLGTVTSIVIEKCEGVSATFAINGNLVINTTAGLSGVQSTLSLGTVVKTAEVFNFEAVKAQYSRKRCVYISRAA